MRFVLGVALLCLVQACRADEPPAEEDPRIEAVAQRVAEAEVKANRTIAAARNHIIDAVANVEKGVVAIVSGAIDAAQKAVNTVVDEAQADGVAAADCAIDANADLLKIGADLPGQLAHCFTEHIHDFDQYAGNVAKDFANIGGNIVVAFHDSAECWDHISCQLKVAAGLIKNEVSTNVDIARNLLQIEATKINAIATTTKCNFQTQADALFHVAQEVPKTVKCISNKRAELKSQN